MYARFTTLHELQHEPQRAAVNVLLVHRVVLNLVRLSVQLPLPV